MEQKGKTSHAKDEPGKKSEADGRKRPPQELGRSFFLNDGVNQWVCHRKTHAGGGKNDDGKRQGMDDRKSAE